MKNGLIAVGVLAAAGFAGSAMAQGTISNVFGTYQLGLNVHGNVYNPNDGVGMRRMTDGYDPISPGTPTESWGAGIVGGETGYADPFFQGTSNLTNLYSNIGPLSAQIGSQVGSSLKVEQDITFADFNVARFRTTITNISGSTATIRYKRLVDWDILPSIFSEYSRPDAPAGNVIQTSYHPFGGEDRNALVDFVSQGPGLFGAGDLGGGLLVEFANVPAGGVINFDIFHAISYENESELQLRNQVYFQGATVVVTGISNPPGALPEYTAALGFATEFIPTPGAAAILGLGGLVAARRRRA